MVDVLLKITNTVSTLQESKEKFYQITNTVE